MTTDLVTSIRAAQLTARKSRSPSASVLTLLIGEATTAAKNAGQEVSDAEMLSSLRKLVKSLKQTLECNITDDQRAQLTLERNTLEQFLPQMVSDGVLTEAIKAIIAEKQVTSIKGMGAVMGELRARFGTSYDGNRAAVLFKTQLNEAYGPRT